MMFTLDDSDPDQLSKDMKKILAISDITVDHECFRITKLKGGISNTIYCVTINSTDKLVFKIFGEGSEKFFNRQQEIEIRKLLSNNNLGAEFISQFSNGICYRFIEGKDMFKNYDAKDPEIAALITTKMAQIHQIPYQRKEICLWPLLEKLISLVPEFKDSLVDGVFDTRQDLTKELKFLRTLLENCSSPVVLCHNDLNLNNILYNISDNSIHFIDIEFAGSNYAAYDIANQIVQTCEFESYDNPKFDFINDLPSKDFQLDWLSKYYTELNLEKTIEEILDTYNLVQKFILCSHLCWGSFALVQDKHSKIDFKFKFYAKERLQEYSRWKNIVINM